MFRRRRRAPQVASSLPVRQEQRMFERQVSFWALLSWLQQKLAELSLRTSSCFDAPNVEGGAQEKALTSGKTRVNADRLRWQLEKLEVEVLLTAFGTTPRRACPWNFTPCVSPASNCAMVCVLSVLLVVRDTDRITRTGSQAPVYLLASVSL